MLALLVASGVLAGCSSSAGPAVWAFDPIWVEPTPEGISGFETWNLYDARWEQHRSERAFVCSVVVRLDGVTAEADCAGCTDAFDVTPTFLESDCVGNLPDDPGFLSLRRLAVGPVAADATADDPYPGQSVGAYADHGAGWESHGWAFPDALDQGEPAGDGWGAEPFDVWPSFAWDLR
jgi:hypothetical protein